MPLRPLEGFTIGVTAGRRWEEQAELLKRRGAAILHGRSIDTRYLAMDDALHRATLAVIQEPPDYLVAITGIGMRTWLESARTYGLGEQLTQALGQTKILARGPKAAGAVKGAGLEVWARSPTERLAELIELLMTESLTGRRVAFQEDGRARSELISTLREVGAEVMAVPVYRWDVPEDTGPAQRLLGAACEGRLDAVTFTSAPAIYNLFLIAAWHGQDESLRRAFNEGDVVAACIGSVCAAAALEEGIEAPLVPPMGRLGLLVRALCDRFQQRQRVMRLAGHDVIVQGTAVLVGDRAVQLSRREHAVFELLTHRPGAVVPRATLLAKVWGSASTNPHLLEVTIARLRNRLGPCGSALRSIPRRGYRLVLDGTDTSALAPT